MRQAIEQRIGPVTSSRVTRVLTLVVVGLVLTSVAGQYFEYLVGFDGYAGTKTLIKLVDMDRERNIPTWYSSATLLLCAALLAKIALAKKRRGSRYVLHWAALSFIFLLIAFDETAVHHEAIGHRLRDAFQPELPISSCLGPSKVPSSTRAIVVSLTDAVNHPIKLTKPSLGVVS